MQPFDPLSLLFIALLNPVVALVGFLMGKKADQPQKLIVAGFIASAAGSAAFWLVTWLRLMPVRGSGGEAGLFVIQLVLGTIWAAIGYYLGRRAS
jgi:hypothetical protein